ncbi:MAG: membrane-bound lytic murein transglycosylase B [Candidatus Azotimanducaceae bacterium]|jgi:membrane-bound lytic murein transglycosylase B
MRLLPNIVLIFSLLVTAAAPCLASSADGPERPAYSDREEVKALVRELVQDSGFNEAELLSIFGQAVYKQHIIDAISRPAERTLNWAEYQDIFLTERRAKSGIAFMHEHHKALLRAQEVYGVPPVLVTAIIGVETMYGRIAGNYRVLDALSTLAFDYPPRSKFFRRELKQFILLAREENQVITELKGSYAGAMGLGQFIPSSYRHYAVDFDGDGFRDIWNNPTDAIGSVANYLSVHGWRPGAAVTLAVDGESLPQDIFNVSLKPSQSMSNMRALGLAATSVEVDGDARISPMRLEGKAGNEYWLGLQNFYVITRYNHSKLYAMAVFQLSESLRLGSGAVNN